LPNKDEKKAGAPSKEDQPAAKPRKKKSVLWREIPEPRAGAARREDADRGDGGFEPRIVAFACNWCSYPAADAAGISKLQYPPNARIIRVMCAGRVHPGFVLRALELGADGVKAAEIVRMLGIGPERVRYEQISAAEAPKFARVMHEFVEEIKKIGPSPLAGTAEGELEVPDAVGEERT